MEDHHFTARTERVVKLGRRHHYTTIALVTAFGIYLLAAVILLKMSKARMTTQLIQYEAAHHQWRALPNVPGGLQDMVVLPNRELWVTNQTDHVYRFDGLVWQRVLNRTFAEVGEHPRQLRGRGNSLWMQLSSGAMAHYRHGTWQRVSHPVLEQNDYTWNADESSVWAIDQSGRIALFDGHQWSEIDMAARASQIPLTGKPLARAYRDPNRGWWLQRNGLWHCDTGSCREFRIDGERCPWVKFIGMTGDWLWFREPMRPWNLLKGRLNTRFFGVHADAPQAMPFWGDALSRSRFRSLKRLPSGQHGLRLVAQQQIIEFDGQAWQPVATLPPLPAAFLHIKRLAAAEHQMVIAEAIKRDLYGFLYHHVWIFLVSFVVVFLLLLGWGTLGSRGLRRAERDLIIASTELVEIERDLHIAASGGDAKALPLYDSKKEWSWQGILILIGLVCLVTLLEIAIGGRYWEWLRLVVIALCPLLLRTFRTDEIITALKAGDYQRVLQQVAQRKKIALDIALDYVAALLYSGRYAEARRLTQAYIANAMREDFDNQSVERLLTQYSQALSGLQHDARAEKALRAAIAFNPKGYAGYCGLAEVFLAQDQHLDQALELAENSLASYPKSRLKDTTKGRDFLWVTQVYAWALSQNDRCAEAQLAIDPDTKRGDRDFKPGMARLHWQASQIARHQGATERMMSHLRLAAELDPQGIIGQAAAAELRLPASTSR